MALSSLSRDAKRTALIAMFNIDRIDSERAVDE
jgi:hypothetical protein